MTDGVTAWRRRRIAAAASRSHDLVWLQRSAGEALRAERLEVDGALYGEEQQLDVDVLHATRHQLG